MMMRFTFPAGTGALARDLRAMALGAVEEQVALRAYSRWRCGGIADLIITPNSLPNLQRVLAFFHKVGSPWAVVGGGSNILFDDAGVRAPIIHIGKALSAIDVRENAMRVEAGAWTPAVARRAQRFGLTGLEHAIGIPGAFGGLVLMNGGSLRQGVGAVVLSVDVIAPNGDMRAWTHAQCAFAYRRSALQETRCVIASATLQLTHGDRADMRRRMITIMADRRAKFPKNLPNCGSVFVSDPALYANFGAPGAVIERCGFKGAREGGAQVSPKHANFIVNAGDATAADIMRLIARVRAGVHAQTGRHMRCEVRFMNELGEVREVHEWLEENDVRQHAEPGKMRS